MYSTPNLKATTKQFKKFGMIRRCCLLKHRWRTKPQIRENCESGSFKRYTYIGQQRMSQTNRMKERLRKDWRVFWRRQKLFETCP